MDVFNPKFGVNYQIEKRGNYFLLCSCSEEPNRILFANPNTKPEKLHMIFEAQSRKNVW